MKCHEKTLIITTSWSLILLEVSNTSKTVRVTNREINNWRKRAGLRSKMRALALNIWIRNGNAYV
jgi:hypothetical protein